MTKSFRSSGSLNCWRIQGRVHRYDRHTGCAEGGRALRIELQSEAREAVTEEVLEVEVTDVARVVVAGDDDARAFELTEPVGRLGEFPFVARGRQVPDDDREIGLHLVDVLDDRLHPLAVERQLSAVDVGELHDPERSRVGAH
jgi:hypothetical protein